MNSHPIEDEDEDVDKGGLQGGSNLTELFLAAHNCVGTYFQSATTRANTIKWQEASLKTHDPWTDPVMNVLAEFGTTIEILPQINLCT